MTATPITPEQLKRIVDAMAAGLDADEAIEAVFPPVPQSPPKRPDVMVTEFPSGLLIGWDFCRFSGGGCGAHVTKCKCKGGPKEPAVFQRWRDEEAVMPQYRKAAGLAPLDERPTGGTKTATLAGADNDEAQADARTTVTIPKDMVPCALGKHLVPLDQAEKNDDGTWACFTCQEAS